MSWMRLLAVGRSIRPVGNQPTRYRMAAGPPKLRRPLVRAHQIGPAQPPVLNRAPQGAKTEVSVNTPQRKVAQAPAMAGRTFVMFRLIKKIFFGKDPKMKTVDAGALSAPGALLNAEVVQPYPLGRWTMFKNPFVKRSKPAEPVAPVQGELLLDLVRPVRNDLSDTDLEVVPASPPPAGDRPPRPSGPQPLGATPAIARAVVETVPSDEVPAWSRAKEQVFGAGKP
jgi:hypothetical protein